VLAIYWYCIVSLLSDDNNIYRIAICDVYIILCENAVVYDNSYTVYYYSLACARLWRVACDLQNPQKQSNKYLKKQLVENVSGSCRKTRKNNSIFGINMKLTVNVRKTTVWCVRTRVSMNKTYVLSISRHRLKHHKWSNENFAARYSSWWGFGIKRIYLT
jgi:hypothetical protein